ncbi:hypothetical protein MP969_25630 [Escherichia coli]|nr:hypothetical protein [Escherichia coli]
MKGVAGAPGDLAQLWQSPNTANTNIPEAQLLNTLYNGHYKPAIANSLTQCDFEKMKVAIYNDGLEVANIIFDGRNTGRDDWFTQSRIISSTFTDLTSQPIQHFQISGDPATGREFYIGGSSSGCSGTGWIMVSTRDTCSYETGPNPGFYYSSGNTIGNYQSGTQQSGDVFAIMGQGGSCSSGATMLPTIVGRPNVCVYNNVIHQEGEWWQDGCQYNCTCEDGERGFYRCYDLCLTYPNLPSQCFLVKPEGECCAVPTGPGCGGSNVCLYEDQTYQQGQTWNDGCDYKCTCVDGNEGRYECTGRCLQFSLPPECHMNPAPDGMCCPVPVCPGALYIGHCDARLFYVVIATAGVDKGFFQHAIYCLQA